MNVLILTGRFGMGHYSVAEAIKQELEKNYSNINISTIDILDYLIPNISKGIYNSFNMLVTRWSNLYNFINTNNEDKSIKTSNCFFIKKIDKLFLEYKPDIVISTLPISSQYISKYKSVRKCNIPLFTFITDISSHNEWIYKNTDYYFVGDYSIKKSLINKGIYENKIFVSGIPVKQNFKGNGSILNKSKSKEILIMGGGLGLISFKTELFEALNNEEDIKTTVITGNNKNMYDYIKNNYKNINVVGYTDKVYKYMQKADLIISKSGGITLFESIYSEVPIYVINPFLVQEIKNARFIEKENIGQVIWKEDLDIVVDVIKTINNDDIILEMKNNMREIKKKINQEELIYVIDKLKKGA